MKALLIIDMQKGCFPPDSTHRDIPGLISRLNMLANKFRHKQHLVIFIQHDGTSENELIPHTDEWTLLPELKRASTDINIDKTANDAFYKTTLEHILSAHNITELYITGAATDFCVDATVKSALSKDYKVTVISDCHTTEGKANFPAHALIDYYNSIWRAMAPTRQKILVDAADSVEI